MKEILINKEAKKKDILLLEDGELKEKYTESDNTNRIEGNMYVGQVKDILQERGKNYGSFSDVSSFVNEFYITNIKSVVDRITEFNNDEYNRAMVALFMIGVKLARLENDVENPHFDSVIDFLGYLELLKETGIKGLELKNNLKCSTLHKRLIEYANN